MIKTDFQDSKYISIICQLQMTSFLYDRLANQLAETMMIQNPATQGSIMAGASIFPRGPGCHVVIFY